ncbi:unnamed protein product [Cuscuta campestris]|uniref:ABC transporter B family member 9 n=1 Tax=Cuscuta campestris TaxID=132261 RepID=A0A484KDT8_9ASTE|nr:unnamed protein product [Cuscuta campestris]
MSRMSTSEGRRRRGKRDSRGGGRRGRYVGDQKVAFHRLFSFADRLDMALMFVGTVGAVVYGVTQPLTTVIFGKLINSFGTVASPRVVPVISQLSIKYVYLAIGSGIAAFLQMSCWVVTGERQAARIRGLYLKAILRQDVAFFDNQTNVGEVIGRMSGDTIIIQEAMGDKVGKFIQYISTFIGGFIIAFVRGWHLALVLCGCVPVIALSAAAMAWIMSTMSSRGQQAYAKAGNVVEQTIGGIRTVASFNGEKRATDKYDRELDVAYKCTAQQGLASGLGLGIILLVVFSTYALAVWYGAKLIMHNGYKGGDVVNVMIAIMMGGMSLGQTLPSINAFASGKAAAYKMFETIEREPSIDASNTTGVTLEDVRGEIELKNVYFRYPARPGVEIFSGFSLRVPSGKNAALVGQSGSGKSTVISLLERFYDPNAGEVLLDNINLKMFKLKWLREQMGLVSQEPILFTTTIKENIAYGKENATDEEIRTAMELANAAKFIDKLPKGLDTMAGQHGTQLSGGQKQRIAIARAILKNPKILLLDEATSALDAESERIVQEALDRVKSNRTTVVVAHRLTTIRNADLIAVVQSGKLLEQGTHDELIRDRNGAYSQLVRMQQGRKEEDQKAKKRPTYSSSDAVEITDSDDLVVLRSSSRRSLSHVSSRHSFSIDYPVSGLINIQESESGNADDDDGDGDGGHPAEKMAMVGRKRVPITRLASLNKPEWPCLLVGTMAAGVHGLIFPVFGILISKAIKIFFEPQPALQRDSRFWAGMYVCLGIVSLFVTPIQNFSFGIAGGKLVRRIRSLTFKKLVCHEIGWFDEPANSSGAVGARLSTDASTIRSLVGDALALVVQNMCTVLAGVTIAFVSNWILAPIVLVLLPLMGVQGFYQNRFNKGFSAAAKVKYEEASQVASDAVGSIRTVASFCAEEKVMAMYERKCEGPVRHGVRVGIVSGSCLGVGAFLLYLSYAVCFLIGAVLIKHEFATFSNLFMVFFALTMSATGVSQATGLAPDLNKAKDSAASIFDILDRKPQVDSSNELGETLPSVRGDIELRHVSFKYPTRPDMQIFKNLCLTMPAGKTCALVGESGSGKSTVISLVERFYDPESGEILLDGVCIKNLKLSWLRQQMGLVSQEPILFNESIWDNIAYGKRGEASEEEIIRAARSSNAHGFISSLPYGYDTPVGERGAQLSGGQKQRIAIARAVLKDPRVLLLDEATSALDTESEHVVQEALDRVMVNRTTVVVAHRLVTIKGADMIAVVKNGMIAEKGRHEELMNIVDGVYASLVSLHMQAS